MLHIPRIDVLILGLCLATIYYYYRSRRRNNLPLPPGPRGWPLIGSALSIPTTFSYKYYDEMGKKLNTNVLYLEVFGQPIVVLTNLKSAQDLLDKRSAIYSSRPRTAMVHELVDLNHMFALLPYGDLWRDQRKLFLQYFSPKNMPVIKGRIEAFVRKSFLPNMLQSPKGYQRHLHDCFGGIAMSITYGFPVRPSGDPWVHMVEECFKITSELIQPGKYFVDVLPWLKYVPAWLPGARFMRDAERWKVLMKEGVVKPFEEAERAMLTGTANPSFVSGVLARHEDSNGAYRLQLIQDTASVVFTAASDTIVGSTLVFILAMLKFPDVQRRAQEEIDSVIGNDRLPEFSDISQLPYVCATMKEAMRWHVIAPTGIPHRLDEDNVYNGYFIPRGSVAIGNSYSILRDEEVFPNPQEFIPERFLRDGKVFTDGNDPEDIGVFGYGRRYLFDLQGLSWSPIVGEGEKPIDVPPRFTGDTGSSVPEPFQCKITPRSGRNVERLLQDFMDVEAI